MLFAEFLQTVKELAENNLPVAIGGVVAVLVLTALCVTTLRRRKPDGFELPAVAAPAVGDGASADENALNWAPPEQSYADRRGSARREGQPVRVLLSSPTFRNGVTDGYVLDRSTGGLRIAMPTGIAPGSTMQARAVNAPDTVGFITLIVRSCRKNGDFFEVGCEFEKTPPWNVLLLFG
jgi:hypothetical protein